MNNFFVVSVEYRSVLTQKLESVYQKTDKNCRVFQAVDFWRVSTSANSSGAYLQKRAFEEGLISRGEGEDGGGLFQIVRAMAESKTMAKILVDQLNGKKDKHENFELLITTTVIIKRVTKCFVKI